MRELPSAEARSAPSAARNRGAIAEVLSRLLPASGLVLEVASGTGEHALWFSALFPAVTWQPTDCDPDALASIAAWRATSSTSNLRPPLRLDVSELPWPVAAAAAVISMNMIHIAPWKATESLMAGARDVLPPEGLLVLYGPFLEGHRPHPESNAAFHADLRARNPAWGLRDVDDVSALAHTHDLDLHDRIAMPANNLTLVFKRR